MKYKINLLPPPEQTFFDRVVFFAFNYVRYILVITQLVVLGVFTYRFTVDQELLDLKETLKQKQEIVKVSAPLINEAMAIEGKTQNVKQLLSNQTTFTDMINYYLSRFPEKITATQITVDDTNINLDGVTQDVAILQNFYLRLKSEKKFKDIQIDNLNKTESGYTFTLTLKSFTS